MRIRVHSLAFAGAAVVSLALASCRPAKKPVTTPTPQRPTGAPANGAPGTPAPGGAAPGSAAALLAGLGGGAPGGDPNPRPYATVITSRARSKSGVFSVHQVGSRLYFEIPSSELGKDFVVTQVLAGTATGIPGLGTWFPGTDKVIRFERRDNRVLMREINYDNVATDTLLSTGRAMSMIQLFPVMAVFSVEAYGRDSAAVIDATRMFTGGIQEFAAGGRRAAVDQSRSFVERFAVFPRNVNVTAMQTFTPVGGANPLAGIPGINIGAPSATTEMYSYSIVRLPDVPMQPRLWDARVGFFDESKSEFGSAEQRVLPRRYVTRWRLECSDQRVGNLCAPKKPITYYIDPATPAWLVPWVKKGVEEWQPAFEGAGFSKGIIAADAPNTPDFSGEDASVAMVRWLATPVQNAVGPSTVDPRTGEIIDADVQMFHNIMDLQRSWYFSQVGHLDARAQKFPFPDTLMGRLVQFVVAHEVGHTLGFPHNFKGSSMYPLDSLRSKGWVARMGHSPSIMDYARFNYVAQPEDNIPLADLVPKVGVYDKFAVKWGYSPIPGATRPEDERRKLDEWARMQDSIPWYRFAGDAGAGGADPAEQSEAIGDADAVRATRYGFRNLERVMKLVEPASTIEKTSDFSLLRTTYGDVIGQWATEANHVTRVVGSMYKQEKAASQSGPVWTVVPKARQKEAVKFLNEEVFRTPRYLINPSILRKLEASGNLGRVAGAQGSALNSLLNNTKMQRMVEYEALATNKSEVYTLGEMLTDLRRGLWSEIYSGASIDAYRRRLQTVYLEAMSSRIKPPAAAAANPLAILLGAGPAASRDSRGLLKDEMRLLDRELASAVSRTGDRTTRAHLMDSRDLIKAMLNVGAND